MKILTVISVLFTFLYVVLNKNIPLIFKLSNALFILGIIYLCIAFIFHVRNVGFFKSLSYYNYVRNYSKEANSKFINENLKNDGKKLMKLHEYCKSKYKNKWPNDVFYKFSIPLLILSLLLSIKP